MEPPPRPSTIPRFPELSVLPPSGRQSWTFQRPVKKINAGPDVTHFLTSQAYRDIGLWIMQLNRALCPRRKPTGAATTYTLASARDDPPSVRRLQALLDRVAAIVDEAPPDPGPRRFGNVSFRAWHKLLEERVGELLVEALAPEVLQVGKEEDASASVKVEMDSEDATPPTAMDELKAYFLGGFGSSQRLDYGTGHELSFLAFLGCLWKLGAFTDGPETVKGDIERSIVLGVIEPYLKVVRKLILTYTLEPAGSHGVWGLDDHSFIPYIFGSAQFTRPIAEDEPTPLEGSVLRAPKPADIIKPETVEVQRELNMYFSAIGFINDVKKGPFWEHSPILWDVSGVKDGWGKINKGMIKMFNAEVLSKFPVVQHFTFGSLFSWDVDPDAPPPAQSVHMANQPIAAGAMAAATGAAPATTMMPPPLGGPVGTAAPWAQGTRMPGGPGVAVPGIPYSRVQPPSVGAARAPPPDPVARQSAGEPVPMSETTAAQITITKAPWA